MNLQKSLLSTFNHSTQNSGVTPLYQAHLRGGGSFFNLEKTMVSVLLKELEHKVEKLKNKKVGGQAAEDQNQMWTSSW